MEGARFKALKNGGLSRLQPFLAQPMTDFQERIEKLPEEKLVYRDNAGVGMYEEDKYAKKINEIIDILNELKLGGEE